MTTTINDRGNLHLWILAPHVQCTHPFWTVELVSRDRRQVDILLVHLYRNFADGLRCIGVEQYAALTADFPNLHDGLQHADLIVGRHDRHQDRLVVNRCLQIVKIDKPVFLHWEIGQAVSILLQALAGIEHRLVFCDRCDDMVALLFVHLGHALDGEVVTFSGARSEYDLLRSGANQLSNALAGLLHRGFGYPPKGMVPAGSVAELFHEEGQHLVQDSGIYRRGGVVIHVDGQFDPLRCRVLLPGHRLHIRVHDCSPACSSRPLKNSGHHIFWEGHDFEPALSCRSPERSRRGSRRVPLSPLFLSFRIGFQPVRNLLFGVFQQPPRIPSCVNPGLSESWLKCQHFLL